ncbi:MAG: EAL domain-containing protein [Sulfurifustis sp.]
MMPTILVVDDRPINRQFLAALLGYAGYRVIEAADGAQALEMVQAHHPALVISDILIPGIEGIDFVNRLRANPGSAPIPMILYTAAYRLDEARALARSCGVRTVIAKPSDPQVILDTVVAELDLAREATAGNETGFRGKGRGQPRLVSERLSDYLQDLVELSERVHAERPQGRAPGREDELPDMADRVLDSFTRVQALCMRLAAVAELSQDLILQRAPDGLVDLVARAGQDIVGAKYVVAAVLDGGHSPRYFAACGLPPTVAEAVRAGLDPHAPLFKALLHDGGPQRLRGLAGPQAAGLPAEHPLVSTLLAVPVRSGVRTYGWLYFGDKLGHDEFSDDDEQFAMTLATQLAQTYENLVLYDELRAHALRLEHQVQERKQVEAALRESRSFLEQAQEVGGVGSWVSGLGDDTTLWWSRHTYRLFGIPEHTPIDLHVFREAVHPNDRHVVDEAVERAIASRIPYTLVHRIVRPDGALRWVYGRADVLYDADGRPKKLIGVVQDITERKEQEDRISRLTRLYALLSGINSTIVRVHERRALLDEACRIAVEHGRFGIAWIGLCTPDEPSVRPVACRGIELEALERLRAMKRAGGTVSEALRTRKAAFCNDIEAAVPVSPVREEALKRGYRSVIALPLIVARAVAGVIVLYAREVGFFDADELKLLNELAGDIAFGLQYIEKEERLDYLAYYDALTGLPNGTLFDDRLTLLLNSAHPDREIVGVVVVDLERFTQINDTLGRHVGDILLRTVAERLTAVCPEPCTVARIGADTFAIALADLGDGAEVADVLNERIFEALHRPCRVDEGEVRLSARAGIALYPNDGADAATLFKNAEAALKQARASGERYLYYSREINASVAEKLALETRVRQAVERREFVLHYQPKVDIRDGRVIGLEALLRWSDPHAGLVLPERFIGVLEETGLILDVGEWVLDQALADYRGWRDGGLDPPRIAVNVSPRQLKQPDFAERVRRAIERRGVGPGSLEIELTETLIMEDIDTNIETLKRISDIGVSIAVDDFGTGYSSLRYLAKLPVDALKIDRSFILTMADDPDSMTIVSTIISLAHSLKLRVVAEGVDAPAQAGLLRELGCDELQGYLHGQVMAAEGIAALLGEKRRR